MNYILRRRGLGHVSCEGIANASQKGLNVVRNDRLPEAMEGYVFRWGCTTTLPSRAERVVNTAKAIGFAADKKRSRLAMQEAGVFVPESWDVSDPSVTLQDCIVRPSQHSQGNHLYYCTNAEQLRDAINTVGDGYISRYIPKVREYRVYIVCGRVVAVADKFPDDPAAIGWNHALGASYKNVKWGNWPLSGCYEAIKACGVVGLDFGGVDVMEDADGRIYVLEVNSAPSLFSEYRTKQMGKAFDYIIEHGKAAIPLGSKNRYRDIIHPAVCEDARIGEPA